MERLTDHENEHYNQPGCNSCSDYRWRSCKESGEIDDCIQRLTWLRLLDIEDILGDDYDMGRLREAVEKQTEYEQFMEQWKQVAEIAGAVKKVGAERVAELVEADRDGRCVVYQSGYPIVSHYCRDDDGLYIREVSGVVSQEEYESMGVSDELHQ